MNADDSVHTTKLGRALQPAAAQLGDAVRAELVNLVAIVEGGGSRALVDFVRRIAESATLSEETRIVADELERVRDELARNEQLSDASMREVMLRVIYCELLGHAAAPFARVAAMRLCTRSNLRCKLVGYLACRLLIRRDSEMVRFSLSLSRQVS